MSYGDIRDVIAGLPHHDPHGGTDYYKHDLFTVRHRIIRQLDPPPRSVFEFGALYGYFLVTALDAAPSIEHVGWVDDESHTIDSNRMCWENVQSRRLVSAEIHYWREQALKWKTRRQWDLVQVDSDHSYDGCLDDLMAAAQLGPRWIFVDDWNADGHREEIRPAVADFMARETHWALAEHETLNGLAVLTDTLAS